MVSLYIEGLFVMRNATYERPADAVDNGGAGTPDAALSANSGRAELNNILAAPFFGVISDLGVENLGVGVGVYVPFGGSATWDQNLDYIGDEQYPGAVDGVQRWSNIEGSQRALYVTLAGAYWIPKARLSIGAGVNLVRQEIETVRARTALGTDDLIAGTDIIVEGRSLVEVEGSSLSVSGGVAWRPTNTLTIGASYQSQPGFGETGLEGTLTNKFGNGESTSSEIELRHSLPDVYRLGAAWFATNRLELRASGDFTRWSLFDKQCLLDLNNPDRNCALTEEGGVDMEAGGAGVVQNVMRNYKDTWGVRAGASYWFEPHVEVFGGGAYDSNAVPDETIDAALFDMDKLIGSVGVRYGIGNRALVTASYTHVAYLEREVDARDRDEDGNAMTMDSPSRNPDGAGTYNQAINLVTIGLQYAF